MSGAGAAGARQSTTAMATATASTHVAEEVGEARRLQPEGDEDPVAISAGGGQADDPHPSRGHAAGQADDDEHGEGGGQGVADGLAEHRAEPRVQELEGVPGRGGVGRHGGVVAEPGHEQDPAGQADDLHRGGGDPEAGDPPAGPPAGEAPEQERRPARAARR